MENPFLLAVALWESREVTIRIFAGARENEPDSPVGGEKPIDWRLLAYDRVQTEVDEGNGFNPPPLLSPESEDSLPDVASRPVRRSFLEPERQDEVGRTNCPTHATRGSCA